MAIIDQYAAAERLISDITKGSKDEQARARLVEIALLHAQAWSGELDPQERDTERYEARERAGFRDPSKGSWCAAGLTAAMEDAGLVVPMPGTPARRGAVALLDWVAAQPGASSTRNGVTQYEMTFAQPGDIIAWLQHPPGKDPAGWRRGHVALIVAVDDVSITTVGWNEGAAPGRVMKRRLWRHHGHVNAHCDPCGGTCRVKPSTTVLHRKPTGLLYGIARPVAR